MEKKKIFILSVMIALFLCFCSICYAENVYCVCSENDIVPEGNYDVIYIVPTQADSCIYLEDVNTEEVVCVGGQNVKFGESCNIERIVVRSSVPVLTIDVPENSFFPDVVIEEFGGVLSMNGSYDTVKLNTQNCTVNAENGSVEYVCITGSNSVLNVADAVGFIEIKKGTCGNRIQVSGLVGRIDVFGDDSACNVTDTGFVKIYEVEEGTANTELDVSGICCDLIVPEQSDTTKCSVNGDGQIYSK